MSKVLLVAEHNGETLNPGVAKCVSCAAKIPDSQIVVLVPGQDVDGVAAQATEINGVHKVLVLDRAENAQSLAAVLAPQIAEVAGGYSHIFGPSTTFGKDLMPRVAALLGVNQVSDIMSVSGAYEFQRPVYAGNAIVTVVADEGAKVVGTIRTASFPASPGGNSAQVESISTTADVPGHTRFVELQAGGGDRPDLQTAARVIAGGRALGSAENFELVFSLADAIGAAVGASRAAVDAGYVSNDLQVGQTGKIIAPDLYMAIGISGAIQHVTGIKDAGTIVAINKDEDAPIFEIADIGLVGDLFQIIPELRKALGS